jgi:ABC-type sugar transport system substrate-binding protein
MIRSKVTDDRRRERHRARRLACAAGIALALSLGLIACSSAGGSSASGSDAPITVAYVPKLAGVSVFNIAYGCLQNHAAALHLQVTQDAPATADAQSQVDIFNSLIERKYKVIITSADDATTLAPTLERAMRDGIKVITFDSDVLPAARNIFVADASVTDVGRSLVNSLVAGLHQGSNPKADIAILSSTPTATAQLEWIAVMMSYMKQKYPGLHVVTTAYGNSDLGQSLTAATNLLKAYPQVKGIIAPDALAAPGSAEAVDKLGLKGKVVVTGLTDPLSIKTYIDNGTVQTVYLWNYCTIGNELAYLSSLAGQGKLPTQFPASVTLGGLGTFEVDSTKTMVSGPVLPITSANVNSLNW